MKRLELQAAMFTPSRLLLRMGYDMKSKDLLLNISLSFLKVFVGYFFPSGHSDHSSYKVHNKLSNSTP